MICLALGRIFPVSTGVQNTRMVAIGRERIGACDSATLARLAALVDSERVVSASGVANTTSDALFPGRFGSQKEDRLLKLVASGLLGPEAWRAEGPPFFMAGLAVVHADSRRPRFG